MGYPRIFAIASAFLAFCSVAAQAVAADTLVLKLRMDGSRADAPALAVERVRRGDYGMPQPALDDLQAGRSWTLQSLDANSRVLFSTPIRNPQRRRLEAFDPATGRIVAVRERLEREAVFEVALPYDPRIARVTILADVPQPPLRAQRRRVLGEFYRLHLDEKLRARDIPTLNSGVSTTTLLESGTPATRLDIVLIGDGYTAAEMGKWEKDAATVATTLMQDALFARNGAAINLRRIDIASNESGVDEPDRNILRDTALDSYFNCANIERLLCASSSKVYGAAGAVLAPDARDVILVVANSTRYGGSGGPFAAISMHAAATELALHELGHTLFGLADEYDYGTCNTSSEPGAGNASLVGTRSVKWGLHIATSTQVPTPTRTYPNGTIGVFVGSQYCATGKYRPTENSRMRTLGQPWHMINERLAVRVFSRYQGAHRPRFWVVQPPIPPAATAAPGTANTSAVPAAQRTPPRTDHRSRDAVGPAPGSRDDPQRR